MNRMKSAPDMKTNARFSRDTVHRAQLRNVTVTDAISISVYLHLATSTVVSSGRGAATAGGADYRHSVAVNHQAGMHKLLCCRNCVLPVDICIYLRIMRKCASGLRQVSDSSVSVFTIPRHFDGGAGARTTDLFFWSFCVF